MHTALTASITDVKAAYSRAYQLAEYNEEQLNRLLKNHFPRADLLLRKAYTLPIAMEFVVRLAVHFQCQYHQVLNHMVRELRLGRIQPAPHPERHQADYYPKYVKLVTGLTH